MVRKFFVVDREGDNKDYGQAFEPVSGQVSEDEVRLETGLLLLFSELALLMEELSEVKDKEPVQSLKILSDTVNNVADFAEQSLGEALREGFLLDALLDASGSFSHLKLLHADHNRLSAQTAINLYGGWTGDANGKNQAFRQISLGMVRVLESYLNYIVEFFSTPYLAQEWKETLEIYINELSELVKSVVYR
ncbi:MAG: hypothetical protein ACREOP_14070 [Thermodesulfobacteriota bacterium]|jgi:hypothetical protein